MNEADTSGRHILSTSIVLLLNTHDGQLRKNSFLYTAKDLRHGDIHTPSVSSTFTFSKAVI